jgi:xanthine dehydrogenase accessory factor
MKSDWLDALRQLRDESQSCVLITAAGLRGSAPTKPGSKMIVTSEGLFHGTIGGGALEHSAIQRAKTLLISGGVLLAKETLTSRDQCCGGEVDLLFDVLFQGPRLHIFGVGHVGVECAIILQGTRFSLRLIDGRDNWVPPKPLPPAITLLQQNPEEYLSSLAPESNRDFALIMTPTHDLDYLLAKRCIQMPFAWVGVIGSRSKAKNFRLQMQKEGLSQDLQDRLISPIGDRSIGSSPREVALAITHEILRQEDMLRQDRS